MWQFLPLASWPEVYWAVELVKALDALADDLAPTSLEAMPPGDRTDAIFTGVVRAYARARGLTVTVPRQRPTARDLARAVGLGACDRRRGRGRVAATMTSATSPGRPRAGHASSACRGTGRLLRTGRGITTSSSAP